MAGATDFLLRRWAGRILLGAGALVGLEKAGLPLPGLLGTLAWLLLVVFGLWALFLLLRAVLRRLLWRIRSKLILSYLFIALVPVLLLSLFFFIAGVLFVGLVASHLVTAEIERLGEALETVAETAMLGLPPADEAAAAALDERLAPARAIHPRVGYALVRRGRVVSASGTAPRALPGWWKGPGFAGLVPSGDEPGTLRAVWATKDGFLALDAPLDAALFADLEQRLGVRVLTRGELEARGTAEKAKPPPGPAVTVEDQGRSVTMRIEDRAPGMAFIAMLERTDWATGKKDALRPLAFRFQAWDLVRRLSPGLIGLEKGERRSLADILVYALGAVAIVFLVLYAVALLLGLLLARSVTRSVHSLSVGTERLRQGDFTHPIQVRSRDQLGELAESFNLMAQGLQDLLRQQAEKQRLEEELRIARQIQMSLLPAPGVGLPGLRISALCLPAAEVGGDYYDLLPLSDTRMGILVADVSGKGTSAALYMAELKGLVLSLSRIYDSPARLLCEANRILAANMDSRSFITMTYAIVDTAARTLRYARAGHNPIIHVEAASGRSRLLTPPGLGLGLDRGERFDEILEEAEAPLRAGDVFLFFTDGLSEAMNPAAELFGESRLRQVIEASEALESDEIQERILSEIRSFVAGAAQHDDMTMVVVKVA
jgi:sigma-B regulation protein RsbU (phosphoserine phosphatase)